MKVRAKASSILLLLRSSRIDGKPKAVKLMIAFVIPLVLLSLACGEDVRDGLWNDKPWDEKDLREAVENNDPEALAEIALWSRQGWQGQRYDEDFIFENASKASQGGSLYGTAILSRCYAIGQGVGKNTRKALKLATKATEGGHPLGLKNFANLKLARSKRTERDHEEWKARTSKAAEEGCMLAETNLIKSSFFGINGFPKNYALGNQQYVDFFRKSAAPIPEIAQIIALFEEKRKKEFRVTDEETARAFAVVEMAAGAGIDASKASLGKYFCENGQVSRGIPLIFEAAESNDVVALKVLIGYFGKYRGRQQLGISTDFPSLYGISQKLFEEGVYSHTVLHYACSSYCFPAPGFRPNPEKAVEVCSKFKEIKKFPSAYHHALAQVYCSEISEHFLNEKRGIAHGVVRAAYIPQGSYDLARQLLQRGTEEDSLARSWAATQNYKKRGGRVRFVNWIEKQLRERITPEELKLAETLVDENYPVAKKFQKRAISVLVEYNDLPLAALSEGWDPGLW